MHCKEQLQALNHLNPLHRDGKFGGTGKLICLPKIVSTSQVLSYVFLLKDNREIGNNQTSKRCVKRMMEKMEKCAKL